MATKTTTAKSSKRKSTSAGPRRSGTLSATSTATKATTAPVSAPEPEVTPEVIEETASATPQTPADDDRLRRPDLIEAIAKRVSLKRSEAKMMFDVVLDEIGKALDASDDVVVPPLGKIMVKKRMEKPGGAMLTIKLKRAEQDPAAGDVAPLAKTDEAV